MALAVVCAVASPAAEIPLAPASPADAIRWAFTHADRIEVGYWDEAAKTFASTELSSDAAWRSDSDAILATATFRSRPHCFCVSPPLRFFREGTLLLTASIHHAEKLRLSVNPQFGELSGDYEVGETTAMGLFRLADTRRREMQEIRRSAEAVLSR